MQWLKRRLRSRLLRWLDAVPAVVWSCPCCGSVDYWESIEPGTCNKCGHPNSDSCSDVDDVSKDFTIRQVGLFGTSEGYASTLLPAIPISHKSRVGLTLRIDTKVDSI